MNERKQQLIIGLNDLQTEEEAGVSLSRRSEIEQNRKAIQDELASIEQAEQQQEREQQIEEKVIGDEITFNVPGVDFKELPAELITLIDRVVRADRRRIYGEENEKMDKLTADHKEALRAAEERELNFKFQNDEMQKVIENGRADNQRLIRDNGDLRDFIATVNAEKADIEQKLRNAAAEIGDQENEIERLNSEIQDMRAAANFGEKQAQQIIDITPEETNDMQNLVNNIAKKYVSITPIAANWHEAVAEDGSKTVVHTKDLPSLETQGSQFRGNDQAGNQEAILPSVNQEATFPSAPNVETVHAPELATGNVSGESTHEQVAEKTEAERISALEGQMNIVNDALAALARRTGMTEAEMKGQVA